MIMNISGHWRFFEEFGHGCDYGVAVLRQNGHEVKGCLVYTEHTFGDGEFFISVDVEGSIRGNQISLFAVSCEIFNVDDEFEYFFDNRHGELVDLDRIEGVSEDEQGFSGRFGMTRIR